MVCVLWLVLFLLVWLVCSVMWVIVKCLVSIV